jgi:hypothetical protein
MGLIGVEVDDSLREETKAEAHRTSRKHQIVICPIILIRRHNLHNFFRGFIFWRSGQLCCGHLFVNQFHKSLLATIMGRYTESFQEHGTLVSSIQL